MVLGPFNLTVIDSYDAVGTPAWGNPGNAAVDDSNYAEASCSNNQVTQYLRARRLSGINIDDEAIITSITVRVRKGMPAQTGVDEHARLIVGDVVQDDNQADTATNWTTFSGTDYASYTFVGEWTGAQLKASGFGFAIAARAFVVFGSGLPRVYHVEVSEIVLQESQAAGKAVAAGII